MKTYKGLLTKLPSNGIFVFGSNTQGRHGAGNALAAKKYFGAIYGQSQGLQGKSYGIITKDLTKSTHPSVSKEFIIEQIKLLYEFAIKNPNLDFYVAYSVTGTLLSGFNINELANMFNQQFIPTNIIFEENFQKLIN